MTKASRMSRSATDRLRRLIEAELTRQNITAEEAAREARLPSGAFRSLIRQKRRPTVDRADELLRAIGISMMIGVTPRNAGSKADDKTKQG